VLEPPATTGGVSGSWLTPYMTRMRYLPYLASMLPLVCPVLCSAEAQTAVLDPKKAAEVVVVSAVPAAAAAIAPVAAPAPEATSTSESVVSTAPVQSDAQQALRDEIARMNLEKEQINATIALSLAKLDKELADKRASTERVEAQTAELRAQQELTDLKNKVAADAELAALKRRFERATLESNIAKAETDAEAAAIRRVENTAKLETAKLTSTMELEQKQAEARTYAMTDPAALSEPLQGRRLVISDRRVALNGPITMDTADQVVARISYYNNKDRKLPIFLVIDDSPGGSVMAGYKILKTMQGSEAPVYVVVKSFAASMAACLTTLAEKSFAYPNAVIMHHQISAFSGGNLTQQQEWVKEMQEWWRRLADPVAQKMGITRDEFIKQMYAHASTGDWNEFADRAKELKWVDEVVDEIEETAMLRDPDARNATPHVVAGSAQQAASGGVSGFSSRPMLSEELDEKGHPCMMLPRINPRDCYWIYNPDGYFRAR
jgi:ATP-dependent Clp protease protease subunit